MKFLLCRTCRDMIALSIGPRACLCGRVQGRYEADGHNAVAAGDYIAFGMHSEDILRIAYLDGLSDAIPALRTAPEVRAFYIPRTSATLHKVERDDPRLTAPVPDP